MDLAFRRMKTVEMNVWMLAIYISTRKESSQITIENIQQSSASWDDPHPRKNVIADGEKIMKGMSSWQTEHGYSHADHAMAFSAYDLRAGEYDIVGVASGNNMCGPFHGSAVEWGGIHTWATAAHELAHNLEVKHDGTLTSADCNTDDYYLMTTSSAYHDTRTIDHGFRFSECSERTILATMARNDRSYNGNCLADEPTERFDLHAIEHRFPGREYTLIQQCEIALGPKSLPCVKPDFEEICIIVYCSNPSKPGQCEYPGDFRAAHGTPCGDFKICAHGKCIEDRVNGKSYNVAFERSRMLSIG